MADFYGMEVRKNESGESLKGVREVEIIRDAFGCKKGEKYKIFKAHSYQVYGSSPDLEVIGRSDECPADAIIHKSLPFISFQTHPEGSLDFFENEIKEVTGDLSPDLLKSAMKDGLKVVENFLRTL